jgi:hypothetical protein
MLFNFELGKISEDMTCKIIDFGTSRIVDSRMTRSIGTPAWIGTIFSTDSQLEKLQKSFKLIVIQRKSMCSVLVRMFLTF